MVRDRDARRSGAWSEAQSSRSYCVPVPYKRCSHHHRQQMHAVTDQLLSCKIFSGAMVVGQAGSSGVLQKLDPLPGRKQR
jgi:hypothetical protein